MKALRFGWRRQQFHTSLQRILCKEAESWHPNPRAGWRAWKKNEVTLRLYNTIVTLPKASNFIGITSSIDSRQICTFFLHIYALPQLLLARRGWWFWCSRLFNWHGSTWALGITVMERNAKRWTCRVSQMLETTRGWCLIVDESQFFSVYSTSVGLENFLYGVFCAWNTQIYQTIQHTINKQRGPDYKFTQIPSCTKCPSQLHLRSIMEKNHRCLYTLENERL